MNTDLMRTLLQLALDYLTFQNRPAITHFKLNIALLQRRTYIVLLVCA